MLILTFDIEEWFHILDNPSTRLENNWGNYESRIHINVDRILELLQEKNQPATFFCLGWIAKKYPEVIKKINNCGYEIGSHSNAHKLIFEQSRSEYQNDLQYSIRILEDLTGKKIKYYRSPGFSIREDTKWAFEILVKEGIEVDSSIFPIKRAHGGFPTISQSEPFLINYNGVQMKEFPLNIYRSFGKNFVFSGGGYFRLIPYWLIKYWTIKSNYIMSYFHPRDFDKTQPMIKELNSLRKFKSYYGLESSFSKLNNWISDFKFINIGLANKIIDWDIVPVIKV